MELVLFLSTLIQRFALSVPEGCKLPSGQLSGDAILVQPEQYKLVLSRRAEVLEDSGNPCSTESAEFTQMTASSFCRKISKNEKGI